MNTLLMNNNSDMKVSFKSCTMKEMNDNFDNIPSGAWCFCEDVQKMFIKIDTMIDIDNIEVIDDFKKDGDNL